MVKKLRLAIVILFIWMPFFYAQAQGGFIEESVWSNIDPTTGNPSDFIITQDGSKFFGVIKRQFDYPDYDEIDFEFSGNVKTYLPADLKAFGLDNGRFFMSKRLPNTPELEFVQILLSGKEQLDLWEGKFFLDNGHEIQPLNIVRKTDTSGGTKRIRKIKIYISFLKNATLGKCGDDLKYLIETADIKESDFIEILEKYHICEGLPYKIHVDRIPTAKTSFTFGLGSGMQFLPKKNIVDRKNSLESPVFYQGFVGLRFDEFRNNPRLSADVRVAYQQSSTTWNSNESNASLIVEGSSPFDQKILSVPLGLNFIVFRTEQVDLYVGAKAGILFNKVKPAEGIIEVTYTHSDRSEISYASLVDYTKVAAMSGVKIGANFSMGADKKLFAEINGDYVFNMYQTSMVLYNKPLETNAAFVSLTLGFEL